ncbi:NACHT domain-containing NTPase [Nonomuraea sp. NEAU-A123]|uniref:NACHT domain-containing protein n=1 Tax=Nonomuraea sp. NEAU-A123 TaxID=2839649 RepID=UPI001BE3D96A|nr:hypothetical protein [Nonomuraea sp. NEAU-A123]MBT2235558.1 hypothetical protein [Nonomuraea sp. NEAU-A123]
MPDNPQVWAVRSSVERCPDRTRPDIVGRRRVSVPRRWFAERLEEALRLCGRSNAQVAQRAATILERRMSVTGGGASNGKADGGRSTGLDRKRISAWSTGADVPHDQHVLEAVVKAVLEALRRQQDQGNLHARTLTPGLLDEQAWLSWWRAARGTPRTEPWLEAYLDAARRVADAHPYPGVLPDAPLPPLSQVYVTQRSRLMPGIADIPGDVGADGSGEMSACADSLAPAQLTAEAIVSAEHDVLLLGGPGAGKTSLLRHALVTLATRARTGPATGIEEIPVYVPASYLNTRGSSFAEQLAAAVRDDLSGRRVPALPADVFDRAPYAGARWLVLLDGLDEITDVRQRLQVTQLLREHRGGPYRFVLASRPLPGEEQGLLERDPHLQGYELLAFDSRQLRVFAEGWMRACHDLDPARLPDPQAAVHAFLAQVARPPLAELAQVPLLATLLCQIHAAGPDRALPRDRYGIYQSFLHLLRQRLHDQHISNLPDAILAALREVAARQHQVGSVSSGGAEANLLAEVLRATEHLRPPDMPPLDWAARRTHLLRRTGLVASRGDDYTFIHQTLGDFLAAQHVAADVRLSHLALITMFGWRSIHGRGGLSGELSSYQRFLMATWHQCPPPHGVPARLTATLNALAGRRDRVRVISDLAVDGVVLAPQILDVASTTLIRLVDDPTLEEDRRVEAAQALAKLGDPRGCDVLAALAVKLMADGWDVEPAQAPTKRRDLPRLGGLAAMHLDELDLFGAVRTLTELGDPRGVGLLTMLATHPSLGGYLRFQAAQLMVEMGDPQGVDLLAALASDTCLNDVSRVKAAQLLMKASDRRARGLLAGLAADSGLHFVGRIRAARALAMLGDQRWRGLLAALALNPDLSGSGRILAAQELAELGDRQGCDLLAELATNAGLHSLGRIHAAWALARVDDSRGRGLLAALAVDPALNDSDHFRAASTLRLLDSPRGRSWLTMGIFDPCRNNDDVGKVIRRLSPVSEISSWRTRVGSWIARRRGVQRRQCSSGDDRP